MFKGHVDFYFMQENCSFFGIVVLGVFVCLVLVVFLFFFFCLDWRFFNVFVVFFLILPSTAGASTSALSDLPLTWMLTQGAHIKKIQTYQAGFLVHIPCGGLSVVLCHFRVSRSFRCTV